MSEEKYYVVYGDEDGDASLCEHTKEEINEDLVEAQEEGYEDKYYSGIPEGKRYIDVSNMNGKIIIKGKIVCPKPKKVVEEWEIE